MTLPNLYFNIIETTGFRGPKAIKNGYAKTKEFLLAMKLHNVKIWPGAVTGNTSNTFMVVTFRQLDSKRCLVIIMASGASAEMLNNDFTKRIKMVVWID